jgi:proteasome accessory factor B
MDAVFYAIRNRRQIRIVVHSVGEGMTQTKFSPYRVLASFDEWQVMGRSSFHRSTRSFPLRSIQSAEKTNDPYGVPRGFRFRQ